MGGPGSGGWYRSGKKDTAEDHRSIDVRRWQRENLIAPGYQFSTQWTNASGNTSTISVQVESRWALRLIYRTRSWGEEEWRDVDYRIDLERTPCQFGGERVWFRCPGRGCNRRVAKLHQVGTYFVCRHCGNLSYESRQGAPSHRAMGKAQKIRKMLGGTANLMMPFPAKPKGMHWKTYDRLRAQGMAQEHYSYQLMSEELGMVERRLVNLDRDIHKATW